MVSVIGDLRGGRRELRPVSGAEGLHRGDGVLLGLGTPDLRQCLLRARVRGLRQRGESIRGFMEPAALPCGLGEHLAQRAPESQRPGRQDRRPHPAAPAVPQQVRPRLRRLPVPAGQGDELLAAISPDADHDQLAQLVLLQPDIHIDPVRPQVHVVRARQVPGSERALLRLPLPGQPRDHRCRQPGRGARELAGRGHEIPGRQPVQVQQRQHLGDLRGLARPRRQDRRGEPLPLPGHRVRPPVIDPRHGHLHSARAGQHLPRLVTAVADHQPAAVLIPLGGTRRDTGINRTPQRPGQHPPRALPHDLINQRPRPGRFIP